MPVIGKESLIGLLKEKIIIVSPMLNYEEQVDNGTINIRLSNKFIVMKKTSEPLLDPREMKKDKIKRYQSIIKLSFGEPFILHPKEFVLASTMEFICLPSDKCAYVLSRSRFGRFGLIIATATYVHPNWKGCLTLELVNFGDVPIKLECGAPIGQLVIHDATQTVQKPQKIIPTGPIFTNIGDDSDWENIIKFKEFWKNYEF
jgi:dCTP deaminase